LGLSEIGFVLHKRLCWRAGIRRRAPAAGGFTGVTPVGEDLAALAISPLICSA